MDSENSSTTTSSAATEAEIETEWTVMGYMAGDNNLNEEMILTLQEIIDISEQNVIWPRIKILALLDPSGLGLPTKHYIFDTPNHPGDPQRYLETYNVGPNSPYDPDVNTGNPKALSGFVQWTINQGHQSNLYHALILSGHGSGSTEDFLMKDDNPVDSLSIPELGEALGDAYKVLGNKKIDLLGMDCCYMSMVETCYQIRDYVDNVVGAESLVPDFGWPYHRILKAAEKQYSQNEADGLGPPAVTPEQLAGIIVKEYIEYYSDYDRAAGRSVDLAWIKLAGMNDLKTAISALGGALMGVLSTDSYREVIVLAHWEAQTYKFDQFVDIKDFCDITSKRFGDLPETTETNAVIQACDDVLIKLKACVGLSGCSGFAYQHSYGLSIYFPWASVFESYRYDGPGPDNYFEFAQNNEWVNFLQAYVKETMRDERGSPTMGAPADLPGPICDAIDALGGHISSMPPGQRKKLAVANLRHLSRLQGVEGSGGQPGGSRYNRSRYNRSRYNRSRWPGDREKSVKNFTPLVGTAYWPYTP